MRTVLRTKAAAVLILGLAACSQTFTAADGTTQTANVPTIVGNIDQLQEVERQSIIEPVAANAGSPYYMGIRNVEATGFKTGFFAAVEIPTDDAGAANFVTDRLSDLGYIGPNGQYNLVANLERASFGSGDTPGTVLNITWTLTDLSGRSVATFTEQSNVKVPFRVAPLGVVRGRLQFAGSMTNNLAQFTERLQ